jgi:hypothetical protein
VVKKQEASRMHQLIITLEASTNRYKDEYAEAIKTTLKTVQDKVNRSMGLLQVTDLDLGVAQCNIYQVWSTGSYRLNVADLPLGCN